VYSRAMKMEEDKLTEWKSIIIFHGN